MPHFKEDNMTEQKLNIYERLHRIMEKVGRVPKAGRNTMQNYDFVTESDVMDKVREACLLEGVIITTSLVNHATTQGTTSKGNTYHLTTVEVELTAINIDNPKETHSWRMIGQGADSQDKGSNKAITGAVKYGLLKAFLVGTGDDAEHDKNDNHDYSPAQAKTAKPSQSVARQTEEAPPHISESSVAFSLDEDTPEWMNEYSPAQAKSTPNGVYAYKLPFDLKDRAKELRCRWNKDNKTWDSQAEIPEFKRYLQG